jgi:hypothetical protein
MDKEEAIKILKDFHDKSALFSVRTAIETLHPELKESEDEKIRKFLIKWIQDNYYHGTTEIPTKTLIAWLEKQGSEPNWCHHKVDLSSCSEEYRKAYYDGWNNCNQQHSQCKSEWNDVVKCLINGMKFYYEDNEEATWGTEKFSMKVKDILSWLEKQGEQKPTIEMKSAEESLGIDSETYNKIVDECIYGERKLDTDFSDLRTWKYIVDAVWTEKEGIGQYLDSPFTEEVAKKLQKRFGNIEQKSQRMVSAEAKEAMYDKPAWSEEDENTIKVLMNIIKKSEIIDSIIYTDSLKEKLYDWLKSLRPQPKQEWSEEDEKMLNRIIEDFSDGKVSNILEVYWLKSIKQRIIG